MKKLFAVLFAWTLFSTQVFAQTVVENEKVSQLQKMIDSHLADLEDTNIEEVQAFFAGKHAKLASLSPEKLEEAISQLENMNLKEAQELAISLGIEEKELSQMTEEEWEQRKSEFMPLLMHQYASERDCRNCRDNGNGSPVTIFFGIIAFFILFIAPHLSIYVLAVALGYLSLIATGEEAQALDLDRLIYKIQKDLGNHGAVVY